MHTRTGKRTTRSLSLPVARSSRVVVSRTMFLLSRIRLFCTKVDGDEGCHNGVARHTAFLTSHGSSPPATHDGVAEQTGFSTSCDSSSPLAAAADASRCLCSTTSALYIASSFWYLQTSIEVTKE